MISYAPLLAALIALLLGLAIGKAWERYKLRDGKWIDRRRARESPHYILGLNFLVANQIDLAIEELSQAASLDARRARSPHDPRQPVPRKGPGRQSHHRASEPAAAAEPEQARTRLRAALPRASTTSAAASSIARSKRSTRCCGSTPRTNTRCSTCRSCTKSSISGPRPTTRGGVCRSWPTPTRSRRTRRFSRSSRTRSASRRCAARSTSRRFAASKAAIDLDARAVPAYLNLGDVRVAAGQRARGGGDLGEG